MKFETLVAYHGGDKPGVKTKISQRYNVSPSTVTKWANQNRVSEAAAYRIAEHERHQIAVDKTLYRKLRFSDV